MFEASAGPDDFGTRYEGHDQVRAAFAGVLDSMPDAQWGDGRHHAAGEELAVSEGRLKATLRDGSRIDVLGCDFLTVRNGQIVRKNSFRKQRPPLTD